jgi:hypothetical protein
MSALAVLAAVGRALALCQRAARCAPWRASRYCLRTRRGATALPGIRADRLALLEDCDSPEHAHTTPQWSSHNYGRAAPGKPTGARAPRRQTGAAFTFVLQLMVPGPPHRALVAAWATDSEPPSVAGAAADDDSDGDMAPHDLAFARRACVPAAQASAGGQAWLFDTLLRMACAHAAPHRPAVSQDMSRAACWPARVCSRHEQGVLRDAVFGCHRARCAVHDECL